MDTNKGRPNDANPGPKIDSPEDDFLDDLINELASDPSTPQWVDIDDLNRLSIQSHQANQGMTPREIGVRGSLHLTGEGITGHSLTLSAAGEVLSNFQAFVTAVGASLEGTRTARGKLPQVILDETALQLDASPSPGSVILEFSPQVPSEESDQLYLPGADPEDEPESLVQKAIESTLEVLSHGGELEQGADEIEFASKVQKAGPRVAKASKAFAEVLAVHSLDLDLNWEVPNSPRRKVAVSATAAKNFSRVLDTVKTDSHLIRIKGAIRELSNVGLEKVSVDVEQAKFSEKEIALPSRISASVSEEAEGLEDFKLGDTVHARIWIEESRLPGRPSSFSFSVISWLTEEQFEANSDEAELEEEAESI